MFFLLIHRSPSLSGYIYWKPLVITDTHCKLKYPLPFEIKGQWQGSIIVFMGYLFLFFVFKCSRVIVWYPWFFNRTYWYTCLLNKSDRFPQLKYHNVKFVVVAQPAVTGFKSYFTWFKRYKCKQESSQSFFAFYSIEIHYVNIKLWFCNSVPLEKKQNKTSSSVTLQLLFFLLKRGYIKCPNSNIKTDLVELFVILESVLYIAEIRFTWIQ